ncbi:probable mitochondrial glutathione transporter SLC25A40 [Oppia nitens]|uniref:probable mitochondrial glutathione transporter SLC25A40 n=1 Tax=Oppia nitens TaxID=1686743 RepID=UPI0023DB19B5|nr:probable mitochondrial glutathione transporter SLC25A40 [Oppia nitens]
MSDLLEEDLAVVNTSVFVNDMTSQLTTSITPVQQMMSSCTGALMTSMFVTPLDVVKIRLQSQQKEFMKNKCYLYCNGLMDHICYCPANTVPSINGNNGSNSGVKTFNSLNRNVLMTRNTHFTGTLDAFIKITRNEGITALWSGLPPTLVMAIPATVIYFTIYDQLRDRTYRKLQLSDEPLWVPVLSGGFARIFAATTISPLEMIRTKMQSKRLSYLQLSEAVLNLLRTQGFFSLWRGLSATIMRDVPFSCIYWANYEYMKKRFNQKEPTFAFSFINGATAGTVAAIITLPFDVVKTHRQIELGEMQIIQNSAKNASKTREILIRIYQQNGFKGLFSGIVPRIIKVAPACAIMISTYEFGKAFFKQYNESKLNK